MQWKPFLKKNEEDDLHSLSNEVPDPDTEFYSWVYRSAIKMRQDILASTGHEFIGGFDTVHAEAIIPDSLYVFIKLLCCDEDNNTSDMLHKRILSIAQDIIFLASSGKTNTPKHLGIGLTVHQATRSKEMVQLLFASGHSVSYDTVMKAECQLANAVLSSYRDDGEVVIPKQFKDIPLRGYIRFANDNLDKNCDTFDGKGSFHGTQTIALCRSAPDHVPYRPRVKIGQERKVTIPPNFNTLLNAPIFVEKPVPWFSYPVSPEWYKCDGVLQKIAEAKDLAWLLCRQHYIIEQRVPAWTGFNHVVSKKPYTKTIIGTLPLLDASAHDNDTLWTIIQNCKTMTHRLGQKYTVITFDQQLYCKAKMLQWNAQEGLDDVIIMLGGFHTQMNFTKVIGEFLSESGIRYIWTESSVYNSNTCDNILSGKHWNRAIKAQIFLRGTVANSLAKIL